MAGLFGFFDYSKEGAGVSKNEAEKSGLVLYFHVLFKRFWKFMKLNLLFLLFSIPSILIIWFLSSYVLSAALSLAKFSSAEIEGISGTIVMFVAGITAAFAAVIGTGAPSAAMSYVMHNYVNDTHSWVWSDFWSSYKSNFLQGTIVFVIDNVVTVLMVVAFWFYNKSMQGAVSVFLSTVVAIMFVVFLMMHMYIYPMMAKFKLKIKDIYKNAAIIAMAKLPWNLLCTAVVVILSFINGYLFLTNGIIGLIMSICIYFALSSFTGMFMTNNYVKKYLLDPATANDEKPETEAVFSDTRIDD